MSVKKRASRRDITKGYPVRKFTATLKRLIDALENGKDFRIQVAGERITIPAGASISIEHERGKDGEDVEFQLRWKND